MTEGKHGDKRYHHHIVINAAGPADLETICSLWSYGDVVDVERIDDRQYLGTSSVGDAQGRDYETMSGKDFLNGMGGVFEFKGHLTGSDHRNTYPYNLQEKQNLMAYSFPGLKGLPHYGDNLQVTFALNPLFADALAVVDGWKGDTGCTIEKGVQTCKVEQER